MSMVLVVFVAVLGGIAGALQSQFLGTMEDKVGTLASTFITYGGGGLAAGLMMLAFKGGQIAGIREVPWYAFTAGLMGLVVVASLGISVSNLGLGAGLTLFLGSTIIVGALIDHFALFGDGRRLDAARMLGIALVVLGTWLVVRG
jgi:transporter family-2 protein